MTPADFWDLWRVQVKAHTRTSLPLTYRVTELPIILDIAEMVEDDAALKATLTTFLTMTEKQRQAHNVKAYTLGFFRLTLPMLMAEHVSEQAEGQKFLDRLNTYR